MPPFRRLGPLSLVVLLQDLEFGGTQRYALHLLRRIDRAIFAPELWVMRGGTDLLPPAGDLGLKISWLSGLPTVGPLALTRLFFRLRQTRPDILYTLTVLPNIWGRTLGRLVGTPTIVSGYRSLMPKQHERWLWPLSDRVICNAQILKTVMIRRFRVDPARIEVIHNAVDSEFFIPRRDQENPIPTLVYAGRLVKEKNPLGLLRAFGEVARVLPTARLIMLGNGPLKREVESTIRTLGLGSVVSLLPAQADIRPYLAQAWVFVLPSRSEAAPNVILEAMSAGLPVVASRVGGIPELVREGVTGNLFAPGDDLALARIIVELLQDAPRRLALGRAAREIVLRDHALDQMARMTEKALLAAAKIEPSAVDV